jgi:hypothetical protein
MARSSTSFGPGNRAAVKTGLRSDRMRAERRAVTAPKVRALLQAFAAEGELDPAAGNEAGSEAAGPPSAGASNRPGTSPNSRAALHSA